MNKCPKCGNELMSNVEGSTLIVSCKKCGFSIVTSRIDPLYEDNCEYQIYLLEGNAISKDNYFIIQSLTNLNMMQIKKIFENLPYMIFKGSAFEVQEIRKKLDKCKVKYKIVPNFKY